MVFLSQIDLMQFCLGSVCLSFPVETAECMVMSRSWEHRSSTVANSKPGTRDQGLGGKQRVVRVGRLLLSSLLLRELRKAEIFSILF